MLLSGGDDSGEPRPNVLHRRYQQIQNWKESETNKVSGVGKDNTLVKFPLAVQFLAACSNSDMDEVNRLLDLGIDINVANVDGLTALHQACIDNDLDLVQFLVHHKADLDVQDNEGWTPLHATASCGYMEVAKFLVENGANLAAVSYDIELPVDVAQGNATQNYLMEEMDKQDVDGTMARASEEKCMLADVAAWLENEEYNPIIDTRSRATPLHVAASKDYAEVIELLLTVPGVDVNAVDADGWTPLHAAAHWGKKRACTLLAEAGADMLAVTFANQNLFDVADDDMGQFLRSLKEEQKLNNQRKVPVPDPSSKVNDQQKRRSSVTRMSVDEKQSLGTKTMEEEREMLKQLGGHIAPIIEEEKTKEEEAKRKAEENAKRKAKEEEEREAAKKKAAEEEEKERIKKRKAEEEDEAAKRKQAKADELKPVTNHVEAIKQAQEKEEEMKKEKRRKEEEEAKKKREEEEAAKKEEEDQKAAALTASRWRPPGDTTISGDSPVPPGMTGSRRRVDISIPEEQVSNSSNDEMKSSEDQPNQVQMRTRRIPRTDDFMNKRVSAVMAPTKAEETETQRSVKARHVRSIRRSTQGVTQEAVEEAKKLIAQAPAVPSIPEQPAQVNSTNSVTNSYSSRSTPNDGSSKENSLDPAADPPRRSRWSRDRTLQEDNSTPSLTSSSSPSHYYGGTDPNTPSRSLSFQNSSPTSSYVSRSRPSSYQSSHLGDSSSQQPPPSPTSRLTPNSRTISTAAVTLSPPSTTASPPSTAPYTNSTNSSISDSTDWRRLYEDEKLTRERLERRLDQQKRELVDQKAEVDKIRREQSSNSISSHSYSSSGISDYDTRCKERKLQEYEQQIKEIEKLRAENAKMKEENSSLIRVISKLSISK